MGVMLNLEPRQPARVRNPGQHARDPRVSRLGRLARTVLAGWAGGRRKRSLLPPQRSRPYLA